MMLTTVPYRSETFIERLIAKKSFWVVFLLLGFTFPLVRTFFRKLPPPLPVYQKIESFSLVNQFGAEFGSKNLEGKVYLANFMFTNCTTSCVQITEALKTIQKRVKGLGTNVAIVTFSVDPKHDTPDVLLKFSQKHHSNPFVWTFLTGSEVDIKTVVVDSFKLVLERQKTDQDISPIDIAHSEKIVLVDYNGNVRGFYGIEKEEINRMMIDLGLLVNYPRTKS